MSTGVSVADGWLSPTRVWRLTKCPASVAPVASRTLSHATTPSSNSGSLAHDAVHRWVESEGYKHSDPRAAMKSAIELATAANGGETPADWTMNRARLIARAPELAAILLTQVRADVRSEQLLTDETYQLRGTPDIVVLGDVTVIIDLKTETLAPDEVPPWIHFQLTIYAHLVSTCYGSMPDSVEIFSLNRGRIPVTVTDADVARSLAAVSSARSADRNDARPDLEVCRYCSRRLYCDPQWAAAAEWNQPDCLEGTVEDIERAANGLAAVRVRSQDGDQWVGGIPGESTAALGVGEHVRFVRIYARQTDADQRHWRWTSVSELAAAAVR